MIIPDRYSLVEWKDVPKQLQKHVLAMKENRRGLYIHGTVGAGKTHLMYAIGKGFEENGVVRSGVLAYNCTDLLRQIREDFNQSDPYSRKNTLENLLDFRGLLMIDDIGSEKVSDWVLETFYTIVNKRYEAMLPTVFTSNLEIHELAERIGDRTVSRIVESCDVFEVTGEDRRLKKHNKIKA
jgi:DNA replication protein DnaC